MSFQEEESRPPPASRTIAGRWPGVTAIHLLDNEVFPVCAPALAHGGHPIEKPQDLKGHTLLHLNWDPNYATWPSWADWLKAAGAAETEATRGIWFNQMSMAIHAAAQGQGVALTSLAIAADELAAGRLIAPFTTSVHTPFGYYFLCRPDQESLPRIAALRDFLVAEAALSAS